MRVWVDESLVGLKSKGRDSVRLWVQLLSNESLSETSLRAQFEREETTLFQSSCRLDDIFAGVEEVGILGKDLAAFAEEDLSGRIIHDRRGASPLEHATVYMVSTHLFTLVFWPIRAKSAGGNCVNVMVVKWDGQIERIPGKPDSFTDRYWCSADALLAFGEAVMAGASSLVDAINSESP